MGTRDCGKTDREEPQLPPPEALRCGPSHLGFHSGIHPDRAFIAGRRQFAVTSSPFEVDF